MPSGPILRTHLQNVTAPHPNFPASSLALPLDKWLRRPFTLGAYFSQGSGAGWHNDMAGREGGALIMDKATWVPRPPTALEAK